MKLVGKFVLIVETATFLVITAIHGFKLIFDNFTSVFANYISTLARNHLESVKGTFDLVILWINSIITGDLPLQATLTYFWNYKITWVGLVIIMYFITNNYIKNR